jgi:hypothetical protein
MPTAKTGSRANDEANENAGEGAGAPKHQAPLEGRRRRRPIRVQKKGNTSQVTAFLQEAQLKADS